MPGVNNERKIFVGGLNLATTDESMKAFFAQFGAVEDAR